MENHGNQAPLERRCLLCGVSESLQRKVQLVEGKGGHRIKEGVSPRGTVEGGRLIPSHGWPPSASRAGSLAQKCFETCGRQDEPRKRMALTGKNGVWHQHHGSKEAFQTFM